MSFKLSFVSGLLLMTGATVAHAQLYSVTDLGTLSGQFPASAATGINAAGQVAGYSSGRIFVTEAVTHKLIDLGPGQGLAINSDGQVTGQILLSTAPGGDAFVTDPTTNAIIDLGTLVCAPGIRCPGGSTGTALNDSGQVTGYSTLESSAAGPRAFITDATTHAMTNLAEACGCQSEGQGINASGQVTGWLRVPSLDQHAFITDASTRAMVDIGTLGGRNSQGRGINASGQVTGDSDGPGGDHAFLYSNGAMFDLGAIGTDTTSRGNAIAGNGQIVGTSLGNGANGVVSRAFLYSGSAMIDLNAAIGSDADLYSLTEALAINEQGQIVANGKEKRTGMSVAFLLTPVPSTTPTASIAASSNTVATGQSFRVTWYSTGTTACTPTGGWVSGVSQITGHADAVFSSVGTYTLGLTCTGPNGTATASTILSVVAPPSIKLAANDMPSGSTVQITWTGFMGATSCAASGSWQGSLPASGSKTVGPFTTDAYFQLTCYGGGVALSAAEQDLTIYRPIPQQSEGIALSQANVFALAVPGLVPYSGGLASGYAFNNSTLPYPLTAFGETFDIGGPYQESGAAKQTIALSTDRLDHLTLLALGVNGNQPNQPFIVTYGDSSASTFVQSVSDWHTPQGYPGETIAVAAGSRITPTGAVQTGIFDLYAYRIPLDSTKPAISLKLPPNRNVILVALNETLALRNAPVSIAPAFNVTAIASPGSVAPNSRLAQGYGLEADLIPAPLVWAGQQFSLGAADQLDAVANTTIPLAVTTATSLTLLATGVNGNQPDMNFVVTYQDGTTTLFRQSVSDWHTPQGYAGESVALSTGFRVTPTGTRQAGPWNLYAYTFPTDPSKAIASLTLPKTRNVVVLAVNALTR